MSTYNELIHEYRKIFIQNNYSPEIVKIFLFELCNEYNINLYLNIDNKVNDDLLIKFNKGIERLLNNEPLNYVLGYSYFYGYKLKVNKDVLIPRVETEELVALILRKYDEYFKGKKIDLCDVGTGSGAIAIALNKEEDNLNIYASDISKEALEIAKYNSNMNDCDINLLYGSMLEPYIENNLKFDILVSNPPYIRRDEIIESSVYDFEPHIALFGGDDGLDYYRQILKDIKKVIKSNSLLFFEIAYDQKDNIIELINKYLPEAYYEIHKDISNKDRMVMIKI